MHSQLTKEDHKKKLDTWYEHYPKIKTLRESIKQTFDQIDAEEYLDKADLAYQDAYATRVKILNNQGQEMHMSDVTYEQPRVTQTDILKKNDTLKLPVCFHCRRTAIASCLVKDSEIVLQLVCGDHIRGEVIWHKEN